MSQLALCLPQTETVRAEYALSLAAMMLRLGTVPCGMSKVVTVNGRGSILPSIRQGIAERAIEIENATHLLWIDADHEFPEDTAHRLLAHGHPWVGINATTRIPPIRTTAVDSALQSVATGPLSKGVERVRRMGFGIVLIEARVFKAMPKPWFLVEYIKAKRKAQAIFRGEDIYFCEKARSAGFHAAIDHDLTKETSHIGAVGWNSATLNEATQTSA